ncbi:TerD family protein [Streptomyces sp. NBC_00091]|uniref:TerD family protein n=1 Tax=Streptomyces sp. NBC_00091 TaxID=2975648 RepID=UPI00225A10A1|nr:TerD family protein [Streptomyces sp. NBC_00091]MCX5380763.1 TerD family protein [Streptomyces sp. NBC_00091]
MSGVRKSLAKVEIALRWDPSPAGTPANDLDIVAAVYGASDPYGEPVYLVHFGSRAPDGTIALGRDSRTGQGFGFDEVMTLELDRLAPELGRVVVGVVIQDPGPAGEPGRKTFAAVAGTGLRIREGWTDLATTDFAELAGASAATVAEFLRDASGGWTLDARMRGFETDPQEFARVMGAPHG